MDILEWLETNAWVTLAMIVLTVVPTVLSVYFYFKSKRVKLPFYSTHSSNLFRDLVGKVESLKILYSDQPVEALTSTRILFWNAGRETIRRGDVADADPLIIRMKGNLQILNHKIIAKNNPANAFTVDILPGGSGIRVAFDFLDRRNGVVIQILHTGTSGKDLKFSGTVIGAGPPKPVDVVAFDPPDFLRRISPRSATALTALAPLFLWIGFFLFLLLLTPPERRWIPENVAIWFIFLMVIAFWTYSRFGGLSRQVPKGLEAFFQTQ